MADESSRAIQAAIDNATSLNMVIQHTPPTKVIQTSNQVVRTPETQNTLHSWSSYWHPRGMVKRGKMKKMTTV